MICSIYFLPLLDRPKINIVFSNTPKVRSCISNLINNSKNYSLEKKKQNTGFVWNAASASDFRHYFYLLMISTKTKFTYTTNFSILLVCLAPQSVNHTSLKNLEILFKNSVFTYLNTSQKYILIRPCILFKFIFVLIFLNLRGGYPTQTPCGRGR